MGKVAWGCAGSCAGAWMRPYRQCRQPVAKIERHTALKGGDANQVHWPHARPFLSCSSGPGSTSTSERDSERGKYSSNRVRSGAWVFGDTCGVRCEWYPRPQGGVLSFRRKVASGNARGDADGFTVMETVGRIRGWRRFVSCHGVAGVTRSSPNVCRLIGVFFGRE